MKSRLPIFATGFAACMTLMVGFIACVLLWAISPNPPLHGLLPYILVGFPAITAAGILMGLLGSLVVGNLLGISFAVSFNLWNAIVGRNEAAAR